MDTLPLGDGTVEISLLSDAVVAEKGWYTETVRRFDAPGGAGASAASAGLLVATGQTWRSVGEADAASWFRASTDGGRSWQDYAPPAPGVDHRRGMGPLVVQRRDGSVVGWARAWNTAPEYAGRPGQPVEHAVVRAASWEALVRGENEVVAATVYVPYMVPLVGDDLKTRYTPAIWGSMVEAEHGYLIQGAYPTMPGEPPRKWAEQKGPARQYRTCVLYSQDDGASWHYLATVASADRYPLPAQAEGYCEPELLALGGGRLLCVMRSGGNPTGRFMERFTPLVTSRSDDGGVSWTAPYPIASYGVAPSLARMAGGIIACLSGRPGFFLVFSADEGHSWSPPYWVSESGGPYRRSSSGYGKVMELEPGVLGVTYDEYTGSGDDGVMTARFRRYRIDLAPRPA